MKKILIFSAVLLAICLTLGAVSADDDWSFNFSSSKSVDTDGGSFSLENNKLNLQGFDFIIPDGYKENECARKLAVEADDIDDAKCSACFFVNGDKQIYVKVFFSDDNPFTNITPLDGQIEKTLADIDGVYEANQYGDDTPTFKYLEDGKLVEINAPDDDTIVSMLKK